MGEITLLLEQVSRGEQGARVAGGGLEDVGVAGVADPSKEGGFGALGLALIRVRARAVRPNSEAYRTMSAACLRTMLSSGFWTASPYFVLISWPFVIGSLTAIRASDSAACPAPYVLDDRDTPLL